MRVLTYNIHSGIGMDGVFSLERIARLIRDEGADIVGLQEVNRYMDEATAFADSVRELAEATDLYSAFGLGFALHSVYPERRALAGRERAEFGNALLSRYPIRWSAAHPLAYFEFPEPFVERRGVLEAKLAVGARDLVVMVTHFGCNELERAEQAREVAARVHGVRGPLLFMGDLNAEPDSEPIRVLETALTRLRPAQEPLFTDPPDRPEKQIDYIFARDLVTTAPARTVPSLASDHLPVVADVAFT
jgi:endonuclease/exonuclease/phosphatase family metal-dependent hydrolase